MTAHDRVADPFLDDAVPSLPPPRRRVRLDRNPVPVPESNRAPSPARRRERGPGGPERMRVERLSVPTGPARRSRTCRLPIHAGEALALIGPSGCGKTTLLRTLNRLTETDRRARRARAACCSTATTSSSSR